MELRHLDDIQIQNYLESPDSLSDELKEHFESCEQCLAELKTYQMLTENILPENQTILSPDFSAKTIAKIKSTAIAPQVADDTSIHILLGSAMSLAGAVVVMYFFFGFERILEQLKGLYYNTLNVEQWKMVIFVKEQYAKLGTTGEILLAAGLIILLLVAVDNYISKAKPGKASFLSV